MQTVSARHAEPTILRLWPATTPAASAQGGLTSALRLSEFFRDWFLPIVLRGEASAEKSTETIYENALAYWTKITGDPAIRAIDEHTVAAFQQGLRQATYKRGLRGQPRPLAEYTIAKHLTSIRTILKRTGRRVKDGAAAALVKRPPPIKVRKPRRARPKPAFPLATAERIVAAAEQMRLPLVLGGELPSRWWLKWLCLAFYTGLRSGTLRALTWDMLVEREDGWWLAIPEAAVAKTGKALDVPVHPQLLAVLLANRTSDARIVPWDHCPRYLIECHEQLQALAGLPEERRMSPHAWRRTFGCEMAKLGAKAGMRVAQWALDHESSETTREFYADLSDLVRRLPDILPPRTDASQLRLF